MRHSQKAPPSIGRPRLLGLLALAAVAATSLGRYCAAAEPAHPDPQSVKALIQDWPKPAQAAAEEMMRRYGPPLEATQSVLMWQGNSPWKRTMVHKSPVAHDFPIKHVDVLQQVVDYRVPLNFFTPLATFDGSLVADRTRGELSAAGDSEQSNVLALNLADDIVQGRKTVDQAREAMAAATRELQAGTTPNDAAKLRLPPPQGDLSDPDTAVVTAR
ncbi:MAG: hypothetical protein NVSMB18_16570 [Acetobacteraceae bacterium]